MAIKIQGTTVIDDGRQLNVIGVNTISNVEISSGIVTAVSGVVTYYGDGSNLDGIEGGAAISTNTTNQAQYIPYATSFGSTTGFGATTLLVYNPNANRLGINTNSPTKTLQVEGEFLVSAGSATTNHIVQKAYRDINGTLSWESTAGQLLSVSNNLTSGSLFNVTNLSGIPYVNVDASGRIDLVSQDTNDVHIGGGVTDGGISLYPATGIVSATAFYGSGSGLTGVSTNFVSAIGIQSAGTVIGAGITQLNFVGTGNTFAVDGTRVDISISSGGGGGASVSISTVAPTSPSDGDLWFDNSDGNTYIWYDSQSVWVVSQTYGY